MTKKQLWPLVSAGLTVLAVAFLVRAIRRSGIGWEALTAVPLPIGISVLGLFAAAVVVSGILWAWLLARLTDEQFTVPDATWAHVQSWLLKYVPGQIGAVAAKIIWGGRRGIPRSRVAASFVYENTFYLLASFVVSLPTVLLLVQESRGRYGAVVALLSAVQLGILALPRVVGPLIERKTGLDGLFLGPSVVVRQELLYVIPRILNGAGFVLLATAVVDVATLDDVLVLAAVYVLAGTLGTLAFLVPGGLGVREAVITALLAPRIGTAEALTLAGSARLYATATDVVLFGAYATVGRRRHLATISDRLRTDAVPDQSPDPKTKDFNR